MGVGTTTLLGDTTIFKLNPIHLSLRYTIRLGGVNPYVEGGYARILYDEQSEIGHVKGEGKGFCAEAGLEFKLSSGFVMEAGAGYNQAVVNPTGFDVELGGWRAGLAFLVAF